MNKRIGLIVFVFGVFCLTLGVMAEDLSTLVGKCLASIPGQILHYNADQLFGLACKKIELPGDIEKEISKNLISNNCLLFYPGIASDIGTKCIQKIDFNAWINFAVFSPDGQCVLIALNDNTVRLYKLSGECIKIFVHDEPFLSAMFSPDGRYILTRSKESKTLRLWNLDGNLIKIFNGDNKIALPAIFTLNGPQGVLPDSNIRVLNVYNQCGQLFRLMALVEFLKPLQDMPYVLQNAPYVLVVSLDYVVSLWSLTDGECVSAFIDDEIAKFAVFSPDGQFVLTCTYEIPPTGIGYTQDHYPDACDFYVKLWNNSGQVVGLFKHVNPVELATFSPDGQYILTYINGGEIKLWGINGQALKIFRHEWGIETAAFSPDGKNILIAGGRRAELREIAYTLRDSEKYRNGQLSLSELAAILLILKFKDVVKQDPEIKNLISSILSKIDEKPQIIRNFYVKFLEN